MTELVAKPPTAVSNTSSIFIAPCIGRVQINHPLIFIGRPITINISRPEASHPVCQRTRSRFDSPRFHPTGAFAKVKCGLRSLIRRTAAKKTVFEFEVQLKVTDEQATIYKRERKWICRCCITFRNRGIIAVSWGAGWERFLNNIVAHATFP